MGIAQRTKLVELSETQSAALFGDYVIREKRNWGDILFDFDSIMFEDNDEENENRMNEDGFIPLILDRLLAILPPIRPRHFSIASAPSKCKETSNDSSAYSVQNGKLGFDLDLCVAVVKGQTPHGRPYQGLCSGYLAHRKAFHFVRVWIRPGSFARLPLEPNDPNRSSSHRLFEAPVLFIGAGTGVAPLRSMIRERETIQKGFIPNGFDSSKDCKPSIIVNTNVDNILIFGCRKSSVDYYYGSEWEVLNNSNRLRVFTAFSQEQARKIYVQKVARELGEGQFIGKHILERGGAVYIAGGAKMARAVRDEIVEALGKILPQGNNGAKNLLKKLQRVGKFNVEAWS
jgi:sulfite reductase alpha subunit-like flavoprotein